MKHYYCSFSTSMPGYAVLSPIKKSLAKSSPDENL